MSNYKKGTQTLNGKSANQSKENNLNTGNHNFKLKQGTKIHKVMELFCAGKKLSCLDHHWLGDTCLHSTVSSISKRFNADIPRQWAMLPNRQNASTRVKQYWFSDNDIAKMKPLISGDCNE